MSKLPLKTLALSAVLLVSTALLAALALDAVARPLWIDEAMAMVSYPLPGLPALFAPLPFYSQASPPLFNAICNVLAGMDLALGRAILLAVILAGSLGAVGWSFRSRAAVVGGLLGVVVISAIIPMASEFKYYGLEILAMCLTLAWVLRKDAHAPIGIADIALLTGAVLLGISTVVFVPLAVGVVLLLRWRTAPAPVWRLLAWREVAALATFLVVTGAYYLAVRHATSIQIGTYGDVYQQRGIAAVVSLVKAMEAAGRITYMPLLAVSILVSLYDWRGRFSQRLLAYGALAGLTFGALALVGLYPVSAARHVTWACGLFLFLLANAANVLAGGGATRPTRIGTAGGWTVAAVAGLATLAALVGPARVLKARDGYAITRNDLAIDALLARPERTVGLWVGGQPVTEFYARRISALKDVTFFGAVNVASAPLSAEMRDPAYLARPYGETSAELEPMDGEPGAWGRMFFYRARLDYSAPAAHFLARAPKGKPFLVFTSHAELDTRDPLDKARVDALLAAIDGAGCTRTVASKGTGYFILAVTCPGGPS